MLAIEIQVVLMIEIKIRKQKSIFESFYVPNIGEYYVLVHIEICKKLRYSSSVIEFNRLEILVKSRSE